METTELSAKQRIDAMTADELRAMDPEAVATLGEAVDEEEYFTIAEDKRAIIDAIMEG